MIKVQAFLNKNSLPIFSNTKKLIIFPDKDILRKKRSEIMFDRKVIRFLVGSTIISSLFSIGIVILTILHHLRIQESILDTRRSLQNSNLEIE
jgi:hypothetical protein